MLIGFCLPICSRWSQKPLDNKWFLLRQTKLMANMNRLRTGLSWQKIIFSNVHFLHVAHSSSSHIAASFLGFLVSAGSQLDVWVCAKMSYKSACRIQSVTVHQSAWHFPDCLSFIRQCLCVCVCSVCRSLCDLYEKKIKEKLFRGHIDTQVTLGQFLGHCNMNSVSLIKTGYLGSSLGGGGNFCLRF